MQPPDTAKQAAPRAAALAIFALLGSEMRGNQLLVAIAIAAHLGHDVQGQAWPSLRRLAWMTGLAKSSVSRALKALTASGAMSCVHAIEWRQHADHITNRYRFHWEHLGTASPLNEQTELAAAKMRIADLERTLYAQRSQELEAQEATGWARSRVQLGSITAEAGPATRPEVKTGSENPEEAPREAPRPQSFDEMRAEHTKLYLEALRRSSVTHRQLPDAIQAVLPDRARVQMQRLAARRR